MGEICEIVISQKGREKLNARGYLMVKDKVSNVNYYWCCESRKSLYCNGRTVTRLSNGQHVLTKFVEHNHSPSARRATVSRLLEQVRTQARYTANAPCQIIQSCMTSAPADIAPCLPSTNALRCTIKRARKLHRPVEPRRLAEVEIPAALKVTLCGEVFLVRDSTVGHDRILLFTTIANVRKLAHAAIWIMDGTFKTVPIVFYQLYTIHACVGSQMFPMVYALMSGKSQALYKRLFEELADFADEHQFCLSPRVIMTDLELAAINAAKSEFQNALNKASFLI
ncbi:hypothetical protein M513_09413, partial [Trichuris suis]